MLEMDDDVDKNPTCKDEQASPAVQAMPEGGVAFYNAGDVAGASQPHKHLQVTMTPQSLWHTMQSRRTTQALAMYM